ncbi:transposase [Rhodopila sp.]|uniref:transposase n=1 Tax=Rhodopila sp. TaxID=2480087 RepID=UPI003D13E4E8
MSEPTGSCRICRRPVGSAYASDQPRLLANDEFWQGNTLRLAFKAVFKVMADGAVEIITGRERRRRWSVEDKLKIVGETLEPGASVNQIAARHDVYPGLLFTWRRQIRCQSVP